MHFTVENQRVLRERDVVVARVTLGVVCRQIQGILPGVAFRAWFSGKSETSAELDLYIAYTECVRACEI